MSPLAHDGGTACTTAPAGQAPDFSTTGLPASSGLYFATCLANLSECDLEKTLRFRIDVTESATGGFTLTTTSLSIGATMVNQTVGDSYVGTGVANADGSAHIAFSSGVIPGAANSISQRDILLVNAVFNGQILSSSAFCAEFDGTIEVKGISAISLDAPGDICIFTRVANENEQVVRKLEDFHCP